MVDEGQVAADAAPPAAPSALDWDAADATDGPTDAILGADKTCGGARSVDSPPKGLGPLARPEWRGPPGRLHLSARGSRASATRCPSSDWSQEFAPQTVLGFFSIQEKVNFNTRYHHIS